MMTPAFQKWNRDIESIRSLNIEWNDKLELSQGQLKFSRGTRDRCIGEPILSDVFTVTKYLESLTAQTAEKCFQSLKESCQNKNSPQTYEQFSKFKKQVKILEEKTQTLSYTFLPPDCNNLRYNKKYSHLSALTFGLLKKIKEVQSTLKKPIERPIKHLEEYNERTASWFEINCHRLKKYPIEETLRAAKKALVYAKNTKFPIGSLVGHILLSPWLFGLSGILTLLKICFWNPIERLICGEVKTLSPLTRATMLMADLGLEKYQNYRRIDHLDLYTNMTNAFINSSPYISHEQLKAFEELVPNLPHLDLSSQHYWVSENPLEFAPLIKEDKRTGVIPIQKYLEYVDKHYHKQSGPLQLHIVQFLYTTANDMYLGQQDSQQSVETFLDKLLKDCFEENVGPFRGITPPQFKKIMELVFRSPKCRKIILSPFVTELPLVCNLLNTYNYKLTKEDGYRKTYERL